jgi:FkbH-like protein
VNFLEAKKILSRMKEGKAARFLLAMSGTASEVELFVRAISAKQGYRTDVRTLPFNTLQQSLLKDPEPGEREIFLLFPWDLVLECDWRSGVPAAPPAVDALAARAAEIAGLLRRRADARVFYVNAPIPPLHADPAETRALASTLAAIALEAGATLLPAETFALGSYLASGSPVAGARLDMVARVLVGAALDIEIASHKVLVTDLDDVLWRGVVGEDGVDGVHFAPEGAGYRHFLYQTLLQRLKSEGILLAAVSRNHPDDALSPFKTGKMILKEDDFVSIIASYNPKSAQITELAKHLNLGLSSFVFVDNNPIELAEVRARAPDVICLAFPEADEALPPFLDEINRLFAKKLVSDEDRSRTELYRRRLQGIAPANVSSASLADFLRGLEMKLTLHDRSKSERGRAVQLINKTTQFNVNGRPVSDKEAADILAAGGCFFTASLSDRSGDHGEILSCLVTADGTAEALVMSCRVFERRVEQAFFAWLAGRGIAPKRLRFAATDRNEPLQRFIEDPAFGPPGGGFVSFDAVRFAEAHRNDLALFKVVEP